MFMNIAKYITIFFITTIIFFGCDSNEIKEEDTSNFKKLSWLKGQWEGEQNDAEIHESWNGVNFRIMEGTSYTIQDGIRVYSQGMRLEQSNNKIFLILTFRDNNDSYTYDLKEISDSKAVFENNEEGFPKTIVYEKGNESMHVSLKGVDGDVRSEYEYQRNG